MSLKLDPTVSIPAFFAGRSILVTGATGFMGKVLIEKLLWSCPDVQEIFLLMRAKKNVSIDDRLRKILTLPVSWRTKRILLFLLCQLVWSWFFERLAVLLEYCLSFEKTLISLIRTIVPVENYCVNHQAMTDMHLLNFVEQVIYSNGDKESQGNSRMHVKKIVKKLF